MVKFCNKCACKCYFLKNILFIQLHSKKLLASAICINIMSNFFLHYKQFELYDYFW